MEKEILELINKALNRQFGLYGLTKEQQIRSKGTIDTLFAVKHALQHGDKASLKILAGIK